MKINQELLTLQAVCIKSKVFKFAFTEEEGHKRSKCLFLNFLVGTSGQIYNSLMIQHNPGPDLEWNPFISDWV